MKKWKCPDYLLAGIGLLSAGIYLGIQFLTGRGPSVVGALFLRLILAVSMQSLFCRVMKLKLFRLLPLLIAAAWSAWGTWLYVTSESWANAAWTDLLAENFSPMIGCLAAWVACERLKGKLNCLSKACENGHAVL